MLLPELAVPGNLDLIVMGTHGRDGLSHAVLARSPRPSCGRPVRRS